MQNKEELGLKSRKHIGVTLIAQAGQSSAEEAKQFKVLLQFKWLHK